MTHETSVIKGSINGLYPKSIIMSFYCHLKIYASIYHRPIYVYGSIYSKRYSRCVILTSIHQYLVNFRVPNGDREEMKNSKHCSYMNTDKGLSRIHNAHVCCMCISVKYMYQVCACTIEVAHVRIK